MQLSDLHTSAAVSEDDWEEAFGLDSEYGTTASNGPQPFTPDQIRRVVWWHGSSEEGYASVDIAGLFELNDGRYATLVAGCDTTGWDCQSSVTWSKQFATLDEAVLYGLDQEARDLYLAARAEGEAQSRG